jgi:hypothetical protein
VVDLRVAGRKATDQYAINPVRVHVHDLKSKTLLLEHIARSRHPAESAHPRPPSVW